MYLHHENVHQLLTNVEEGLFTIVQVWSTVARDNASNHGEQWNGGVGDLHFVIEGGCICVEDV